MLTEQQLAERILSEDYHADHSRISNSMMGDFLDSRLGYHGMYVAGTIPPTDPTRQMEFGTAGHLALLQPDLFSSLVVEIPAEVLSSNGSRAGKAWKQFEAENAGKLLMKAAEMERIGGVREAIMAEPMARMFLEGEGPVERVFRWQCDQTGLDLRAMLDKVSLAAGMSVLLDLKTTSHAYIKPEAFGPHGWKSGYARQMAHYEDGLLNNGVDFDSHLFIAVTTKPPYICTLHSYRTDGGSTTDTLKAANIQRDWILEQINACHQTNDWSEVYQKAVNCVAAKSFDIKYWESINEHR